MKYVLILHCTLLYLFSFFNCYKSNPVIDTVSDQYHPISFSSYMKKNVDNLEYIGNPGKSNVFDAVRKHYEMDNGTAGDLLKYLQAKTQYPKTKYPKSGIFNAKYIRTDKNLILYDYDDYDSDVFTTISYFPLGDVYLDKNQHRRW